MQVEGDTQLQQGINWTALLGSLGSVKLTVHVDRVVFAGVGTVVVCPGRGIVAQHQHQGSNKEEISAGHFDTKKIQFTVGSDHLILLGFYLPCLHFFRCPVGPKFLNWSF